MHRPGRRLPFRFRGFAGEVSRVAQRGFVTIEGLLDEEIATAIHQETHGSTHGSTHGDPWVDPGDPGSNLLSFQKIGGIPPSRV